MRIVVALGGNALLERGEPLTAENQLKNITKAAKSLAQIAKDHELIIAHGNGPQVGLLALQGAAYEDVDTYPLDILGAETEGQIGYLIEQQLGNIMPKDHRFATILTQIEVDPNDPAFKDPTKFIGPVYNKEDIEKIAKEKGWSYKADGEYWRRVVPSPLPKRIFEINVIKMLVENKVTVICAGGGGIPTMFKEDGSLTGVEAVIDKDFAAALLAKEVEADALMILTDVDCVYLNWGTDEQKGIKELSPAHSIELNLPAGSMGPKVQAASEYVINGGGSAYIGKLDSVVEVLNNSSGTRVNKDCDTVKLY